MPSRNRPALRPNIASKSDERTSVLDQQICYEGESLAFLLNLIKSEMDSARNLDSTLPEKVWIKQDFSIGVNEVTRELEQMNHTTPAKYSSHRQLINSSQTVQLQAILLASDCNPRWLMKPLPNLACSRGVPLIFVKDNRAASLRLGKLLKLKTAIAIGIEARGNVINQLIEIKEFIGKEIHVYTSESTHLPLT